MLSFTASPVKLRPRVQVAQIATHLAVTTQPAGAVDGEAFTTQPIVAMRDANSDLVTGGALVITAAKASGSGTLAGDTTIQCVNGVATFLDLEIAGTGTHTLSFSASGLTGATSSGFDVAAGGGDPTVTPLFFSDWSTATGETTNAVTDGGKWTNAFNNSSDRVTVVSTSGLGFPAGMTNCLAIRHRTSQFCGVDVTDGWDAPVAGETRFFRLYFRNSIQGTDPGDTAHPVISQAEPDAYALVHSAGATYTFAINCTNDSDHATHTHRFQLTSSLTRDEVYRVEWKIHRVDSNTVTFDARVYDDADVLLYSAANFSCTWHSGAHTMATVGNIDYASSTIMNGLGDMFISHEGDTWGPWTDEVGNRTYYGGVGVSDEDWCGAYGNLTGEP